MKTHYNISVQSIRGIIITFLTLLCTLASAQEIAYPTVSDTKISLDSLTCSGTFVHASAIAKDYIYTDKNNNTVTEHPKLTYTWLMSDSVVLVTDYSEATLCTPVKNELLKLVVSNQWDNKDSDTISIPSWGVQAAYKLTVRERDVPHEVTKGDALSAPVNVEFENNSLGNYTVSEWSMGSIARLFDENAVYQFQQPGEYRIALTVTNEFSGCSHTDSTEVVMVTEADIRFPDAFTPNGDGMNDELGPAYKSIQKYNVAIYDRRGRRIFSASNPEQGWDGKNGNSEAAEGVYIYICEAEAYERGISFTRKGTVTLIR